MFQKIINHLGDRGLTDLSGVILSENFAHFLLYSLGGKLVGYQRYNPLGIKKSRSNTLHEKAKYFTYIPRLEIAYWGAHTYRWDSPILFITEGIFDAVKVHNAGYPCLALLTATPSRQTSGLINMLPQEKVKIFDNGGAAKNPFKRIRGTKVYPPCEYGDLGDMPQEEANVFINQIIKKIHAK